MMATTAYAAETTVGKTEANYLQEAVQVHSDEIGMPIEVVGYAITQEDDFTVCSMLVKPQPFTKTESLGEYAVDTWYYKEEYVGDIYAIADFEWNNTSATVIDHVYQTGNWNSNATFNVTKESWANSGALNKAYYKITYAVKYNNISKSRTLEVTCDKNGVIGGNGGIRYF